MSLAMNSSGAILGSAARVCALLALAFVFTVDANPALAKKYEKADQYETGKYPEVYDDDDDDHDDDDDGRLASRDSDDDDDDDHGDDDDDDSDD